jgi:hypothetical protein
VFRRDVAAWWWQWLFGLDSAIRKPLEAILVIASEFLKPACVYYSAQVADYFDGQAAVGFDLVHFQFSGSVFRIST